VSQGYVVKFPIAGLGTVKDRKWSVPGSKSLEELLNKATSYLSLGPHIGFDPDWYIANMMAKDQSGTVLSEPRGLTDAERNSNPDVDY
jgi:hypothetical protein